ncbi:tetratricopeptide repeat protein [Nocardia anaemiae]|uniref:tetratricopeptide repeat protein n=1 Tax=Nocardia anaemiae TaxID=263910 RepID=UPI0007A370F3|nr:tetratricopeptide repeat protein [Nocardia anaemiae]
MASGDSTRDALEHRDPVDVIVRRARTLLHRGRPKAAEHALRVALIREPQHVESHAVLAIALSRQNEHAAALAEAKEAIRLAPHWWYPHYVAGTVLHGAHRKDDALRAARAAQYFDPRVPAIWTLLARIHMAREEWRLSAQAARAGLTHDPHNAELVSLMTMALSEIGAPGAMASAAQAVRLDPEDPLAHFAYGYAAMATRDIDKAVSAFQEALRLDPSMDVARQQLVEALKRRNPVYRGMVWLQKENMGEAIAPLVAKTLHWGLLWAICWAQWTVGALLTWRLSRDTEHRQILRGNDLHAAWLSLLALAVGAVMLVGGIAYNHPETGIAAAGLATLALVTPIQETFATPTQPARRILGCWTILLVAALATSLGIAVIPASPDELGASPVLVMLAALASVWVAHTIRRVFKRRHRRLTL